MRASEYFHALRCLPGTWVVLRLDGRGFTKFTEREGFDKPFDSRFHDLMQRTAESLLTELQGIYAYTESDEISVLFRQDWDLFDREVEKLVSISAGIASAAFSLACQKSGACFDSRIWLGSGKVQVIDYFRWRQDDATRCALNGWCYWTLRKEGKSVAEATALLDGRTQGFKNDLLLQRGIDFKELPPWQIRGTGMYWVTYEKAGYNPVLRQEAVAIRRRVKIDEALPAKDDYAAFMRGILEAGHTAE
jgi:tRNA(His) 5'-end guanylyltransferase